MAKDDRKLVTRTKILDAALVLFAKHGLEGTTVGDIAARATVAHGTVFLHFVSKPGIYAEAIRVAAMRFLHDMRNTDGHGRGPICDGGRTLGPGTYRGYEFPPGCSGPWTATTAIATWKTAAKWVNGEFEAFWQQLAATPGTCHLENRSRASRHGRASS